MIKAMGIIRFLGLTALWLFIIGITIVLIMLFAIGIRALIQMFKDMYFGLSSSCKAQHFDCCIRRFESD